MPFPINGKRSILRTKSHIVPIFEALTSPSNATTSSPPPSLSLQSTQAKLESHRGAIVGGVIGGVVALAFIAAAMILTRRRLHRPDTRTEPIAKDVKELDRSEPRHELEVPTSELGSPLPELDVQNQFRAQGKTALS